MGQLKNKIKQVFCKHDYVWVECIKSQDNKLGQASYRVCRKCGKLIQKVFIPYG